MNSILVVSVLALFLSDVIFCGLGRDKQGPYEIHTKFLEDCVDSSTALIKLYPKVKKVTRNTIEVDGKLVLNVTFDNHIKVLMNFGKSTSQGWKDNFLITDLNNKGLCDVMAEYLKPEESLNIFQGLISGSKNSSGCPIDAGVLTIKEIVFRIEEFKGVPIFFYGTFRARFGMYKNDFSGPEIGCIMFYIDIVPKAKNNKRKG